MKRRRFVRGLALLTSVLLVTAFLLYRAGIIDPHGLSDRNGLAVYGAKVNARESSRSSRVAPPDLSGTGKQLLGTSRNLEPYFRDRRSLKLSNSHYDHVGK